MYLCHIVEQTVFTQCFFPKIVWSCEKGAGEHPPHPPVPLNCQAGCPRHWETPRSLVYSLLHVASSGSSLPLLLVFTACAGINLENFPLILVNYAYLPQLRNNNKNLHAVFQRGHRRASQWQAVILHPHPKGGKDSHTCLDLCLDVNPWTSPLPCHVSVI